MIPWLGWGIVHVARRHVLKVSVLTIETGDKTVDLVIVLMVPCITTDLFRKSRNKVQRGLAHLGIRA